MADARAQDRRGDGHLMAGGLRILAVEDQATNVALLRAVLARASEPVVREAELTIAPSLAAGHAALAAGSFDAILLDRRLPDGDGLELARELMKLPDRPRIIILTAQALPAEEAAAREAGADAFLAKPYQPSVLVETLLAQVPAATS